MTKEELIKKVSSEGYAVDLTLQDDCLYCSATEESYFLQNFDVVMEYDFDENGQTKKTQNCSINRVRPFGILYNLNK
ncbi:MULTISPECIES: hypothetical protein [unclassified Paraflavitalea]|uniref:hypothetical protein n=1 Tax=unclassified Paraflavitalea TaxID=2798305 RepID=UPI003D3599DB